MAKIEKQNLKILKKRADQWLVEQGLATTREKAKALVMAGQVLAGSRRIEKPGDMLNQAVALTLSLKEGATLKYVSRGGLKLEKALEAFEINPAGQIVLDIGASTGGFTDCVLQRGAEQVIAVDVGHSQLDWSIQTNSRVIVLDKTNIRYLEKLPNELLAQLVVIDVSFISLKLVLPAARKLSEPTAKIVALVKPQFEAGREQVGKGGIIRNAQVHRTVLQDLVKWCEGQNIEIYGLIDSPILGTEGNREFLIQLGWQPNDQQPKPDIAFVIDGLINAKAAELEEERKQD